MQHFESVSSVTRSPLGVAEPEGLLQTPLIQPSNQDLACQPSTIGGQSGSTTMTKDDTSNAMSEEYPDFFYAHNPFKYNEYSSNWSGNYEDMRSFIRNSLDKHQQLGNTTKEGISSVRVWEACVVEVPSAVPKDQRDRHQYLLVRQQLFGTPLTELVATRYTATQALMMSSQTTPALANDATRVRSYSTRAQSRKGGAAMISSERWESFKPEIERLDRFEGLPNLMETMKQKYEFTATKAQYVRQLAKWGFFQTLIAKSSDCLVEDDISNEGVFTEATSSLRSVAESSNDSGYHSIAGRSQEDVYLAQSIDEGLIHDLSDPDFRRVVLSDDERHYLPWWPKRRTRFNEIPAVARAKGTSMLNGLEAVNSDFQHDMTVNRTMNQISDRYDHDELLAHVFDVIKSPMDRAIRADFHASGAGAVPSSRADGRTGLADIPSLDSSSPTPLKTVRTESLSPVREASVESSEFESCGLRDRSCVSSDIDLCNDLYRNTLDLFLDWVDKYYMQELLVSFNERPQALAFPPSFRSHTTDSSSAAHLLHQPILSETCLKGPAGQEVQNGKTLDSSTAKKKRKVKLACHFYKRDAGKFSMGRYKTCPLGFDGLHRLKGHQEYVHKPSHYCKRCKLIFKTQDQKDVHDDQDVRCERRDDPNFADYLTTEEQRAALGRKKPAGVKEEDFWFEMWDKYFPFAERPASPFQDIDPTLAAFQTFAEGQLFSAVEAYNAYNPEHGLDMEELSAFWRFAIYHAVANFASQQRFMPSPYSIPTPVTVPAASQHQEQFDAYFDEVMQWIDNSNSAVPDTVPAELSGPP